MRADRPARQGAARRSSRTQLVDDAGLTDAQAAQCLALADIRSTDTSFVERVRALGVNHELLDVGLTELAAVIEGCANIDARRVTVEADLRIARGLDYYTGTVFETRMSGYESLGSICSGGRYDALASDGKVTYPGVGISLGVTRLLMPLFADGVVSASRAVPSAVLVALPDEDSRAASDTDRPGPARPRHRHRGRRVAAEVRQADPLRRASRHPVRLVRRRRRDRPGEGHPQR